MIGENINKSRPRPKILLVPLDWGLGHATRCIPIIKELNKFSDVILAGEGAVVVLLQSEFPDIKILHLKGYNIRYNKGKKGFAFKILTQLIKIKTSVTLEQSWLKKAIIDHKIDGVISDNRPGLYHKDIPTVYITHQLGFETGSKTLNRLLQKMHYKYINRFQTCWVPDFERNGIAGTLSHPSKLPLPKVEYIGLLSRCMKMPVLKKYDALLLLSGPEPQRTILEEILLKTFEHSDLSFVLVRGLPGNNISIKTNGITYGHLKSEDLNSLIQESKVVIARSGYSTIMDLVKLKQKAILIPTPGQYEQEYLADHLMKKKMFAVLKQDELSLEKITHVMQNFEADFDRINDEMKQDVIRKWMASL